MENNTSFKINGEYIELLALLKALGIAQTGGHAKMIVDSEGSLVMEILSCGEEQNASKEILF